MAGSTSHNDRLGHHAAESELQSPASETTPLLATEPTNPNLVPTNTALDAPKQSSSRFKLQLAIVFLIQLCEPISGIMIYAFVNQFVRSTGVTKGDEKATGYYAGIIESLFFWAEGATVLSWQLISDRVGRRPVMLLAPLGLGFSMIGFGLSKAFWCLVVFRAFQGIFNGDVGVTKTVLGEITDETNRAEVLALIPAIWSVGSCLAPFIGGVFSSPEDHWPNSLGKIQLLRDHPYFLPCAISATVCFATFLLACVGLEESAPAVLRRRRAIQSTSNGTSSQSSAQPDVVKPVKWRELMTKPIIHAIGVGGLFAMCSMFNSSLQPLIWSTSIENGGLGFTAFRIGSINTLYGIPNAIFQLTCLGRLVRRFGPRRLIIVALSSCMVVLAIYPLAVYFAAKAGGADWRVWTLIVIQLICVSAFRGGYASIQVFLVEASPTPEALGTIQGLAQTVGVLSRGVAPSIATSLFALSKERNVLGGQLVFLLLEIAVFTSLLVALRLRTSKS